MLFFLGITCTDELCTVIPIKFLRHGQLWLNVDFKLSDLALKESTIENHLRKKTSINSITVYTAILMLKSFNLLLEAEFIQASKHLVPSSARKQNNEEIWLWIALNHLSFLEVYTNPNSPGRDSEKEELVTFFYNIAHFFRNKHNWV